MDKFDPLADLDPAAYAPFRDPRDYILSWTDQIWIDKGLGRLGEHYADDIKVHTAYGETYDFNHVLTNSVQKMSAFPNGGGGSGEDVIWEQRGPMGFISSHRVLKTGTNLGHWTYGPPTGRNWISRTIAHCVVQDGKVVEEWLVRDEYAVLLSLGIDPEQVAADMVHASPITGEVLAITDETPAFSGNYPEPGREGLSGRRPDRFQAECDAIVAMYDEVWNRKRFDRVSAYCDPKVVSHTVRLHRAQGIDGYQQQVIDLLAAFPDGRIEVRDLVVCQSDELGMRIAAIWTLHGTYSGVPLYGPPTRKPVKVMGATHFEMKDNKILREWRLFDEIAVMAQIIGARTTAAA
ncbi:ester cyclase [Novosphingobium tardum]|uniref:Ester cyclase n=1 Tax=Novosphingobium tardum TaxID=1538021 RepID=A0ABV8RRQ9_9SPHN